MKVLSLFDGISCGMVALERAGIPVERYFAYEIEPSAIAISKKNYPDIIQCGDVFNTDFCSFAIQDIDLLIGGSPCTHWSIAKSGRETTSDGVGFRLFMQFVKALRFARPKHFIYENNYSIDKNIKKAISAELCVEPIIINSSLVSAQNRKRCYWTNIPNVKEPQDKGILLSSILESGAVDREKSLCLTRRYAGFTGSQSYLRRRYIGKSMGQAVFENTDIKEQKAIYDNDPYQEKPTNGYIRPLTEIECERLQTLPDNYTKGFSRIRRIEAIGNGWTVDVIAHILKHLKEVRKECYTKG